MSDAPVGSAGMVQAHRSARLRTAAVASARAATTAAAVTPPTLPATARETSYYFFGGQRVAMRQKTNGVSTVTRLHGNHLGSASLTTDASGAKTSELRYTPYGKVRYSRASMPTDRRFQGQLSVGTFADFGARFDDPTLGRFLSPDSIVPGAGDPQSFNRYSFVRGNSLSRVDPSGPCGWNVR